MLTLPYTTLETNYINRLGVIVLQSDMTIEDEFRYYFTEAETSLMVSRIPFENEVTPDTLKAMEGHLNASMDLFPIGANFDAIGYACTSGALNIGHDAISAHIKKMRPTQHVTDPLLAALTAMRQHNIRNIAYISPYAENISQHMVDYFKQNGINSVVASTFNQPHDNIVAMIHPESIYDAAINIAHNYNNIDAFFISCTNLKTASVIPRIEQATNMMALSSNQALAWHLAHATHCNISPDKGRVFSII